MGRIKEAWMDGYICDHCSHIIDNTSPGHPRTCSACLKLEAAEWEHQRQQQAKLPYSQFELSLADFIQVDDISGQVIGTKLAAMKCYCKEPCISVWDITNQTRHDYTYDQLCQSQVLCSYDPEQFHPDNHPDKDYDLSDLLPKEPD